MTAGKLRQLPSNPTTIPLDIKLLGQILNGDVTFYSTTRLLPSCALYKNYNVMLYGKSVKRRKTQVSHLYEGGHFLEDI